MAYLILGLVIFLGVHSVRIVADDWRSQHHRAHRREALEGGSIRWCRCWASC